MKLSPVMCEKRDLLLVRARETREKLNFAVQGFNATTTAAFQAVSNRERDYGEALNALEAFAQRMASADSWQTGRLDSDFLNEWDDFSSGPLVYRDLPKGLHEEPDGLIKMFEKKPLSSDDVVDVEEPDKYVHDYKVYCGSRDFNNHTIVLVRFQRKDGDSMTQALNPRADIQDHGPGFEWGYAGSGPSQLALALIADMLDKSENLARVQQTDPKHTIEAPCNGAHYAQKYHQPFKRALIEWILTDDWEFDERSLMGILATMVINID